MFLQRETQLQSESESDVVLVLVLDLPLIIDWNFGPSLWVTMDLGPRQTSGQWPADGLASLFFTQYSVFQYFGIHAKFKFRRLCRV